MTISTSKSIASPTNGWRTMKFGDLAGNSGLFIDGDWVESKDQDPNGDVRLIQLADVGDGKYIDKSSRFLTSEKARELKCTYLQSGDILIARMPDPLGRACVFPGESMPCVTVVDVCILRPDPQIVDTNWLKLAINFSGFRHNLNQFISGTTRQRISRKNLEKIPIKLPPLDEQRRIAAVLDKADALREKRRQAISKLDTLVQAVFLDMFGDPVKNPKGWAKEKMGDLMLIRRGGSPRPIEKFLGGDINWIKIGDATGGNQIYLESCKEKITRAGLSKTVHLKSGSLIFANCGVSLGFARILKIDGCIHDGWLSFEEIPVDKLDKIFLLKALNIMTNHFRAIAPSGTQPNLNTGIMKSFGMIVPPLDKQKKFAKFVENSERLRQKVKTATQKLDDLFHSLQQRAFNGELFNSKAATAALPQKTMTTPQPELFD